MVIDMQETELVPLAAHHHEHGVTEVSDLAHVKDPGHSSHAGTLLQLSASSISTDGVYLRLEIVADWNIVLLEVLFERLSDHVPTKEDLYSVNSHC